MLDVLHLLILSMRNACVKCTFAELSITARHEEARADQIRPWRISTRRHHYDYLVSKGPRRSVTDSFLEITSERHFAYALTCIQRDFVVVFRIYWYKQSVRLLACV